MEICTEIKLRLTYMAIYEVGANRLLYYCRTSFVFDNDIDMTKYINRVVKEVQEKENKKINIFKTVVYEQFPVRFIWREDGGKIYISEKQD